MDLNANSKFDFLYTLYCINQLKERGFEIADLRMTCCTDRRTVARRIIPCIIYSIRARKFPYCRDVRQCGSQERMFAEAVSAWRYRFLGQYRKVHNLAILSRTVPLPRTGRRGSNHICPRLIPSRNRRSNHIPKALGPPGPSSCPYSGA
jgi:hypothetical protein